MNNPLSPQPHRGLDLWIHAAHMSRLAYEDAAKWREATLAAGWDESGYLDPGSGFQAGFAWSEEFDELEIACCGSSELRDLTLDLTSWFPNRWSELPAKWWLGYGMVKGPRRAWPEIVDLFERYEPSHVLWDGHSKGGAEAQAAHAATILRGIRSSCVAIEPPRLFGSRTRDRYRLELSAGSLCAVVVNTEDGYRDAVTAHPCNLKHGGDLGVLGESTIFEGDDALGEWRRYKRARQGWGLRRRVRGRLGAHAIDGVIEHMEALSRGPA